MTETKTIQIPAPNFRDMVVTVRGRAPGLLCDQYGTRTLNEIKEREAHPNRRQAKKPRDGEREWRESLYMIAAANGKPAVYGFPSAGVKKAMLAAAGRFAGLDKMGPTLGGAIQLESPHGDLLALRSSEPRGVEHARAIKGVRSSVVYRGLFDEWEMDIPLRFDADLLDESQILNLIARAGEQVGIGNWRPEKKGIYGRFEIVGGKA